MSEKTLTEEEIINKACEQLADKFTSSEEFNNLKEAGEKIDKNEEARQLLQEYQSVMQSQQQMGGMAFGSGKAEKIKTKMEDNQIIKQYMVAEEEWSNLLEKFFEESSRELEFDILSALGGCC